MEGREKWGISCVLKIVLPGKGYIMNILINGLFGMHCDFFSYNVDSRKAQSSIQKL